MTTAETSAAARSGLLKNVSDGKANVLRLALAHVVAELGGLGGTVHVRGLGGNLLLSFDIPTGQVQVVDAGSPQLWRHRDKTVEHVTFEAQFPLGMFDETPYIAQEFSVLPGDRLIFVSDGVYSAVTRTGEAYGERQLARAIQAASLLPAAAVPRAVLRELNSSRDVDVDAEDDALVLCLDWIGRVGHGG